MKNDPYPHLLCVYGSLKSPYYNNRVMVGEADDDVKHAKLIGPCTTLPKFFMADGVFPRVSKSIVGSFPRGEKATDFLGQVRGELWQLDNEALAACDLLESHPRFYRREQVTVTLDGTRERRRAWFYVVVGSVSPHSCTRKSSDGILEWTGEALARWSSV